MTELIEKPQPNESRDFPPKSFEATLIAMKERTVKIRREQAITGVYRIDRLNLHLLHRDSPQLYEQSYHRGVSFILLYDNPDDIHTVETVDAIGGHGYGSLQFDYYIPYEFEDEDKTRIYSTEKMVAATVMMPKMLAKAALEGREKAPAKPYDETTMSFDVNLNKALKLLERRMEINRARAKMRPDLKRHEHDIRFHAAALYVALNELSDSDDFEYLKGTLNPSLIKKADKIFRKECRYFLSSEWQASWDKIQAQKSIVKRVALKLQQSLPKP